jgi:Homeobox KN domain
MDPTYSDNTHSFLYKPTIACPSPYRPGSESPHGNMKKDKKVLRASLEKYVDRPYPTKDEKKHLMEQTGMTRK